MDGVAAGVVNPANLRRPCQDSQDKDFELLSLQSWSHAAPLWENMHATRFEGYRLPVASGRFLGALLEVFWGSWGLSWGPFVASCGHLGGILGLGIREEAPRGPGEAARHPRRAARGPQVEAQDGPEGPKMHPREGKDDVGNENEESLKNDDPPNENA